MYLGKLNAPNAPVQASLTAVKQEGYATPEFEKNGNPLNGEELLVKWSQLYLSPLVIKVTLSGTSYLDSVCLSLSQSCTPEKITVFDAKDGQLLATYAAETGKKLSGKEVSLVVGTELCAFRIVIDAPFSDIGLKNLELYGAVGEDQPIFPTPSAASFGANTLPIGDFLTFIADCPEGTRASEILADKLQERFGLKLASAENAAIRFCRKAALAANAYRITLEPKGILLEAPDLRGFTMAAETLLKTIRNDAYPTGTIEDAPRFPFRGVHVFIPPVGKFDFAERLVKYVLCPLGYNYVILEIAGGMRFESHPEITETVLRVKEQSRKGLCDPLPHGGTGGDGVAEKADVAAFADYIRSFGIDVIPEVQSLSHVQYFTVTYPELGEYEEGPEAAIDERFADANNKKNYAHCYCPSQERCYEIMLDLLDEIIDVVRPTQYVHMGHDEVYQIGVCPVCKTKDPAELYYQDVMRYHDHLAKRGLKMMIWSDMLQPSSPYKTVPAVEKLPRDIVMMDFIWYFHLDLDLEQTLTEKGYPVVIGNLYSSHFPRYEKRVQNPGIIGGQLSFWTQVEEEILGREGKIYDLFFTSQMLWSPTYTHLLRYSYDRVIRRQMPEIRDLLGARKSPSLLPGHQENVLFQRPQAPDPELDPTGLDLQLNAKCDSIVISHVAQQKLTRKPWVSLEDMGEYLITFADGSSQSFPVKYEGNVGHWNRRQAEPLPNPFYRHNGYIGTYFADTTESRLRDGRIVSVYHYECILNNASPVTRIQYLPAPQARSQVVVYKVTGIRK